MSITKKILYITYDGLTDQLGQSQILPYLRSLAKQGFQITILSTEKKKRFEQKKDGIRKSLEEAGIRWEMIFFSSRPPVLAKVYDQWNLNRKASRLYKQEKYDFIHCRSYVPVAAAFRLKKRFGVPYLFDMRGFWVDERVDNGQWKLKNPFYRLLYRVYKKKERNYLREASRIIVLTEKGRSELEQHFSVPARKITMIPCCVDMEHFNYHLFSGEEKKAFRKKINIPEGAKVLSYLGALGGWYLTSEMLQFFKTLHERDNQAIFFFITGHAPEEILRLASLYGVPSEAIRIKAAERSEVPGYLSVSDWSVFFIRDAYSKKASSPTKQGEIMAMGIPIVCNDIGDTGAIIEKTGAGIVVGGFNEKEYTHAAGLLEKYTGCEKEKIRQGAFRFYDLQGAVGLYSGVYNLMA
jgi:glycosyltransferase involved in cell wall biosynthesis